VLEEFQFLELGGERVFAAHYIPDRAVQRVAVLCHPLGEEKLWAHRVFVSLARELARAGVAVLRVDFRGEGDSDREFRASDFQSRVADICLAIDSIREWHPSASDVSLLGLRFGAAVATAAAVARNDIDRLILWDPVSDGAAYMQSVLRLNLMAQMALHHKVIENRDALVARLEQGGTVNIEGYELDLALFRQASGFRLDATLAQYPGEVVIAQVDQGENPVKPEFLAIVADSAKRRVIAVREEHFWKEIRTFCQRAPELTRLTLEAMGIAE
jgi:exosortase A-associated hydrolase 2